MTTKRLGKIGGMALFFSVLSADAMATPLRDDAVSPGIHAFYQGDYSNFVRSARTALSLDYVSAFSFDIPWRLIEPSEDKYDWSLIDQVVALAAERHKKISVGLEIDWWAPDWVRDQSASYTFRHHVLGSLTSPVPWDPFYVRQLSKMVAAFGRRYNGNPALLFVVISGPATYWGTETNWAMVPGSISQSDQRVLGFSLAKFEAGWKQMTDAYVGAFPDTPLAIALNDQINLRDRPGAPLNALEASSSVKRIRDYAFAQEATRGRKIWLELLGLSKGGDGHYKGPNIGAASITPYEALVWDVRDRAHIVYQNTVFMRQHNYSADDVAKDLAIGISFGADAIEIYCGDLFTLSGKIWEPYRDAISQANARMTK